MTTMEHALRAAFERAGYDPSRDQLFAAACDALHRADGRVERAAHFLANAMMENRPLLYAAAKIYVAWADEGRRQGNDGGRGQAKGDLHIDSAPSPSPDAERGDQKPFAKDGPGVDETTLRTPTDPPAAPVAGTGARGDQSLCVESDQVTVETTRPAPHNATPEIAGRGDQIDGASNGHISVDPTPRAPLPFRPRSDLQRRSALRVWGSNADALLKTFRLRDGTLLATVRWADLPALVVSSKREALILQKVYRHARNPDPNATVADVVKASEFAAMVDEAEREAADAA